MTFNIWQHWGKETQQAAALNEQDNDYTEFNKEKNFVSLCGCANAEEACRLALQANWFEMLWTLDSTSGDRRKPGSSSGNEVGQKAKAH